MAKKIKIGWCIDSPEHTVVFEEPKRVILDKDQSINKKNYLSCPAVRSYFDNTFYVASPYSIKIKFVEKQNHFQIHPIYPFTSIDEKKFTNLITLEHFSSWKNNHTPIIQIPSPYVFFADEDISIEQSSPLILNQSKINWRTIPGKFNIYAWQRPLNWAFEWDTRLGEFEIKVGDPIYLIKFMHNIKKNQNYELKYYDINTKIEQRLKLTKNITSVKKGVNPLIEKLRKDRKKLKLL